MITDSKPQTSSVFANPWIQLVLGIICMASVANLQYGWTLFVNPIDAKFHWGRAAIQVAFTTFVLIETWLVPVEGYLVDRFGPRPVVIFGGVLVAIAWVMNSVADSLPMLYLAAAIGGVGTGCVLVIGMLHAVTTPGFAPPFTFPYVAAFAVAAAVVGGSVIATVAPAYRSSRASIVASIHRD